MPYLPTPQARQNPTVQPKAAMGMKPPTTPPPGAFSGISDVVRRRNSSSFLRPGMYWAKIDAMKYVADRLTNWRFITEMTILRVTDPGPSNSPNPVGDNVSYMLKRATDRFMEDLSVMIGGILGLTAAEITEQNILDLISDRQPLANMIVEVQVVAQPRKPKPNGEVLPDWNNVYFKREVPASEALGVLDQPAQDRFFPNQGLQRMAELEAQLLAQQKASQ